MLDLLEINESLAQLARSDAFAYSDSASILLLEQAKGVLECLTAKATAAFDASGEWAAEGAQSVAAWLSTRCHLPLAEARRQLRRGKAMAGAPLCAEAWAHGAIGVAQFDVLATAARGVVGVNEAAFVRDEASLVQAAHELTFAPFRAVVAYWSQLADPDGAEVSDMERRARRNVFLSQSVGAMFLGQMTLDPISGTIVAHELTRLETELFAADWAEAKERLGHEPKLGDLARSAAQRRADALVEMATRSAALPEGARRPAPLFSVMVDYATLSGRVLELAHGAVLSPGALVPWLATASFERVVFAPGKRIECSVHARLFSGATRRAIELRDRICTHPYCEVRAEQCQIDHIVPFAKGGPTTQENGRVLCAFHNRLRNVGPDPGD